MEISLSLSFFLLFIFFFSFSFSHALRFCLSGRTDSGLVLEPLPRELPWAGARKFFILSGVFVTIAFCVNMVPIIVDVSKGTAFLLLALPLLLVLALVWYGKRGGLGTRRQAARERDACLLLF